MLLTKLQREFYDLLCRFGALREDQIISLIRMQNERVKPDCILFPILRSGLAFREGDFIVCKGGAIREESIIAIDVMLTIESKELVCFQKGVFPFDLTFFKERSGKLWRYDIAVIATGKEPLVSAVLEGILPNHRLIIFVLNHPEQQKLLYAPCDICFAWCENGEYKFYMEEKKYEI